MDWHKRLVEKTLKAWGISNYQAMWIAFFKGLVIGGLIMYYCVYSS